VDALERPLAIVGFMGAGKSTLGRQLAETIARPFVDVDDLVEAEYGGTVSELFARDGEERFREVEEQWALAMLEAPDAGVVALGGGAIESERTRARLRELATTVWLDVPVDEAWRRARGTARPLAQDEDGFGAHYERRRPLYEAAADFVARDLDDLVLAAGGVHVEVGALERLGDLVPGVGQVELVSDTRVAGIYGMDVQLALAGRIAAGHELPQGEKAKTVWAVERLWQELRLDRSGTLLALGGGCTTDAAGFAAAVYLRGIDWIAVPTTLVGQVDAAIGGKTAIDLPAGKNLVGAFHWPVRTIIDPATLETLPETELANGRAELVKTGLLAGEPLWELPLPEAVRRAAAFKTAVCLRDPHDRGERAQLNLGHTFAHALETAARFELPHGRAVALGLLAALRLSGLDPRVVEEELRPEPIRVDPERAWAALARDKKAVGGVPRLVLLDAPGKPIVGVELPERVLRSALESLIDG
jgi:shikimate kinase/3-dehydroquinate synthase